MGPENPWAEMRDRIVGLGEQSHRKSYYPELQQKIGELELARQRLAESEAALRAIFDSVTEAIYLQDPATGAILDVNQNMGRMFGLTRDEALGATISDISLNEPPYAHAEAMEWIRKAAAGQAQQYEWRARHKSGRVFWVEIGMCLAVIGGKECIIAAARDITERKQAETQQKQLEMELQQAQKMESVGRLAGGVAHDFNNMLSVILGHTEIALCEIEADNPLREDLEGIQEAARRSAELTRQLLAFARRQAAAPRLIDLNETIEGMLKMLRRLIGEDIDLAWFPGRDTGPILMDPSQIDQILANLSVNSRDAITGIGKITIETHAVSLDDAYCAEHAEFVPGDYVALVFSDNGCGMDKNTLGKIFEPFFTTKDLGLGTGLGLATVYGVVRQNGGFIHVYSEPGQGTAFRIYLPRAEGQGAEETSSRDTQPIRGHGETVLLVEDEAAVLKSGKVSLEKLGYRVLTAPTPREAVQFVERYGAEIALLMTDVIMPEMNGRDLAARIALMEPRIKCLFTSGYTADVIAHHGILDAGVHFIQKPYSIKELSEKVREVLKAPLSC